MEEHDKDGNGSTTEVGRVGDERLVLSEAKLDLAAARVVLEVRVVVCRDAVFEKLLCLDFKVFHLNEQVRLRKTTKTSNDTQGLLFAALVHEPTRRLGHEEDTDGKDDGRKDLDGDRDQPSRAALSCTRSADVVCAICEPVRYHDTKGNGKLRCSSSCEGIEDEDDDEEGMVSVFFFFWS